jgi:hypothetical protein
VGIAVDMDYGCASVGGSGSNEYADNPGILPTYFGYKTGAVQHARPSYDATAWFNLFKTEFDAVPARPIIFSVFASDGGHEIVADGYQIGDINYVHVNMGWSGSNDGYYNVDGDFTAGYTWLGASHVIVTGIQPDTTVPPPPSQQTVLSEAFDTSTIPSGWTTVDHAGTGKVWSFNDPGSWTNLTGGTGNFAIADSDYAGAFNMDTDLRTPVLNLAGFSAVYLSFNTYFNNHTSEVADIDVSTNGAAGPWTNFWRKTGSDFEGFQLLDISSLATNQPNVMIRFRYYNANNAWYWQVDDVKVVAVPAVHLTVNHFYSSAGSINGGGTISGSGISCSSVNAGTQTGTCSASFNPGSTVTLAAAADANSTFYGWTGGGCTGTDGCSFAINASTIVYGTFAGAYKAKINGGNGYDTLSLAHANAGSGAIILARELHNATSLAVEPFTENLTVTKPLALKGGYNAGFSSNAGLYSTLAGILTVGGSTGSLTLENLIIK